MAGQHSDGGKTTAAPAQGPAIQGNAQQASQTGGKHADSGRAVDAGRSSIRPRHQA